MSYARQPHHGTAQPMYNGHMPYGQSERQYESRNGYKTGPHDGRRNDRPRRLSGDVMNPYGVRRRRDLLDEPGMGDSYAGIHSERNGIPEIHYAANGDHQSGEEDYRTAPRSKSRPPEQNHSQPMNPYYQSPEHWDVQRDYYNHKADHRSRTGRTNAVPKDDNLHLNHNNYQSNGSSRSTDWSRQSTEGYRNQEQTAGNDESDPDV